MGFWHNPQLHAHSKPVPVLCASACKSQAALSGADWYKSYKSCYDSYPNQPFGDHYQPMHDVITLVGMLPDCGARETDMHAAAQVEPLHHKSDEGITRTLNLIEHAGCTDQPTSYRKTAVKEQCCGPNAARKDTHQNIRTPSQNKEKEMSPCPFPPCSTACCPKSSGHAASKPPCPEVKSSKITHTHYGTTTRPVMADRTLHVHQCESTSYQFCQPRKHMTASVTPHCI